MTLSLSSRSIEKEILSLLESFIRKRLRGFKEIENIGKVFCAEKLRAKNQDFDKNSFPSRIYEKTEILKMTKC